MSNSSIARNNNRRSGSFSNPPSKPGTPKPPDLLGGGAGGGAGAPGVEDGVYKATTAVVRAVMEMTRGVQQAHAEQYVDLVKVSQHRKSRTGSRNWK